MSIAAIVTMYVVVLVYAGLAYFLGDLVALATVLFWFGLLIIPYLTFEWIVTPLVAAVMGFQARWSLRRALLLGAPLVILFTAATPVVSSGSPSLPVPVPWLSVYEASKTQVAPVIRERLVWWGALYLAAIGAGRISRRVRPLGVG